MARYRETNGAVGYEWNGAVILILTTRRRSNGEPREVPLIFATDGDRQVVVASKGGAPEHPYWYRDLAADPAVTVQVGADRFAAAARTAEGAERDRLWALVNEVWPRYESYQASTDRLIPVVVLERAS